MNGVSKVLAQFVQEHADELTTLFTSRSVLIRAPHINLADLARWDERIAAHHDGLAVAGEEGARACEALLGGTDGRVMFESVLGALRSAERVALSTAAVGAGAGPTRLAGEQHR